MSRRFVFHLICAVMLAIPVAALGTMVFHHRVEPGPVGDKRFSLPNLRDENRTLSYPAENRPHIVNVFASWCASCAVEHGLLMQLQQKYGVRMHGIAWRDGREKARLWLEKRGDPYVSVGLDETGEAGQFLLDLEGVPETLVLSGEGEILYRQRGPLTADIMRDMIAPLLVE